MKSGYIYTGKTKGSDFICKDGNREGGGDGGDRDRGGEGMDGGSSMKVFIKDGKQKEGEKRNSRR